MTTNNRNHLTNPVGFGKVILLFLFIFAPGYGYAEKLKHRHDSTRLEKKLKLTPDQKTKLSQIRMELKKNILPLKNLVNEKKAHLQTLQTAEKADLKQIYATIDELQELKTKIQKLRATHRQEIRQLLTSEQRLNFDLRSRNKRKMRPVRDRRSHDRQKD